MSESTVAASFVRSLLELAVRKGAARETLLAACGVDPAQLQNPDNRVQLAKYVALMRSAKELCHDPALALHFGEEVDMAEMTVIGQFSLPSSTMADAAAQLNRYSSLAIDVERGLDRFEIAQIDGDIWLIDHRPTPNETTEITESFFARAITGIRRFFGDRPFVKAIHVTHPEPSYSAEYQRIFRIPVVFESSRNALVLTSEAWSTMRAAVPSSYAAGVLKAHADALLEKLESSKTTRGRVEDLLGSLLHTGEVSVDHIAGKLGLSRQTLFRKLKAEGVTFEKLLDETRHKLALHYLNDKKVSVNETAYLLGFSDPAAFSRAFKRWTGSSPSAARSQHQ